MPFVSINKPLGLTKPANDKAPWMITDLEEIARIELSLVSTASLYCEILDHDLFSEKLVLACFVQELDELTYQMVRHVDKKPICIFGVENE